MRPFSWLSLCLFAIYFVYGAYIPFWSLWLQARGLSPESIGLLIGLGLGIRFIGNILIMAKTNRASLLLSSCRYLAITCLLFFLGFYFTGSFWGLLVLMLIVNFLYPTMLPLSDAIAARMMMQVNLDYGKVRLWGSTAFIVGSTLVGFLIKEFSAEWILHTMIAGLVLLCVFSWLPMSPAPQDMEISANNRSGYLDLLTDRPFLVFLVVVSLLQGSHAAYYGFSALYWKANGYAENVIGYLWALGVCAEVLMFALSRRLLKNLSYQQMFWIGGVGCLVRWSVLASTTDIRLLALSQLLHAVTFCVVHLGAIRYMTQQLPSSQLIPAQTLYAALPTGIVTAVFTAIAGWGYQYVQGQVFWLMFLLVLPVFAIRLPQRSPDSGQ